jgi:hypothetical protein
MHGRVGDGRCWFTRAAGRAAHRRPGPTLGQSRRSLDCTRHVTSTSARLGPRENVKSGKKDAALRQRHGRRLSGHDSLGSQAPHIQHQCALDGAVALASKASAGQWGSALVRRRRRARRPPPHRDPAGDPRSQRRRERRARARGAVARADPRHAERVGAVSGRRGPVTMGRPTRPTCDRHARTLEAIIQQRLRAGRS